MDVESTSKDAMAGSSKAPPPHRKRRKTICLWSIAAILTIVIILVILGLTVLKPKRPTTTVDSVSVKDLKFAVDILRLQVQLNVTLDAAVSVKNPNKVGFKFSDTSALVSYRGRVVGEAPIPAGKINPDQKLPFNLTLTLFADRLLSSSSLYSDVVSGTLPLTASTRISGHVYIFNFIKVHAVSYTTCDMNLNIMSRTVGDKTCHYKTKL